MSWLVSFASASADAPRLLYCVPHAGAGASIYRPWVVPMSPGVAVVGVQPPGREQRRAEPVFDDISLLGQRAAEAIAAHADRPFTLFGHSLGALVAFETARALVDLGRPPRRLIISGCRAPQLPRAGGPPPNDAEVKRKLRALGGPAAALLAEPELLALFIPVLRSDLWLAANYAMQERPPLAFPIAALGGLADPEVPRSELLAWRQQAGGAFEAALFPGGHFYLHEDKEAVQGAIRRLAEA